RDLEPGGPDGRALPERLLRDQARADGLLRLAPDRAAAERRLGERDRALLRAVRDPQAPARPRPPDRSGPAPRGGRADERRGVRPPDRGRDGEAKAHPGDDAQRQARPLGRARVSFARRPPRRGSGAEGPLNRYSTTTRSLAPWPKVSGLYISSARGGGTTNVPGVVARAT